MKKFLIMISLILTAVFLTACGISDNVESLISDAGSLLNDAGSLFSDVGNFFNDAGSYIGGLIENVFDGHKTEATEENQTDQITADVAPQSFYLTYSLNCSDYNSVGSEWSFSACINGVQYYPDSTITLAPGEDFEWRLEVIESDKNSSDSGSAGETMTLSDEICMNGYTKSGDITVKEDDGRYIGNVALWTYTFKLTPVSTTDEKEPD